MIAHFAAHYGPAWVQHAAAHSPLGYRFMIGRGKPTTPPYADWHAIVRYAFQCGAGGYVTNEFLAEMVWYAGARTVHPDYITARTSADPRLAALAQHDRHRYGPITAPVFPVHVLDSLPHGGRWNDARWVSLLVHNGGPYQLPRLR
jgi:hypothetical protein